MVRTYCIGFKKENGLGVHSEFSWYGNSSWPSGCAAKSRPYSLW